MLRIVASAILVVSATAVQAEDPEKPRFHHTHVNAVDPAASIQWYKTIFSAVPVKYRGVADAVLVDRSFILFTKVAQPAPWKLESAIYHIGWGGIETSRIDESMRTLHGCFVEATSSAS